MQNRIKQYSFQNANPKIYLIATPIGNLQEMTPRAIEILKNDVAKIYCEDTRNTLKLLNYFNIKKELVSLNKDNEFSRLENLLQDLANNLSIALVSDAGYPLISDPGYYIINKILQEYDYDVVPISGSSAFLNALVGSGLDPTHFLFYGFLSNHNSKRIKEIETLVFFPYTIIFYESPHRLVATIKDLLKIFGNRQIAIAKELTKIHEQFYRGKITDILLFFENEENLTIGEYVIVLQGANGQETIKLTVSDEVLVAEINVLVHSKNYRIKQAIDIVASKYDISKNILYNKYHKGS